MFEDPADRVWEQVIQALNVPAPEPPPTPPSPRDCCPICGHQFDEVKEVNVCPCKGHWNIQKEFTPDELITDSDDYLYCQ